MELTDWRGNTYSQGTRVIYAAMSGRSVELQEATVLEINTVYKDPETYSWKRLGQDEPIPKKRIWNHDLGEYVDSVEDVDTELRVKLQPEGKGSRNFSMRNDTEIDWVNTITGQEDDGTLISKEYWEPARAEARQRTGHTYGVDYNAVSAKIAEDGWEQRQTPIKPRAVTLTVINNITVI